MQQGEVLRSCVLEKKDIRCNIRASHFQLFTKLLLFQKSLFTVKEHLSELCLDSWYIIRVYLFHYICGFDHFYS